MDNLNVNNCAASVGNYYSNIGHVTESSSNGDLLNLQTSFDVGTESVGF